MKLSSGRWVRSFLSRAIGWVAYLLVVLVAIIPGSIWWLFNDKGYVESVLDTADAIIVVVMFAAQGGP